MRDILSSLSSLLFFIVIYNMNQKIINLEEKYMVIKDIK